jgi:hypothetical protein
MKFDEDLAAVHAYLCGDGYVIRNPITQKKKYYHIGFRNTNETLLKDFQERFERIFGLQPHITNEGRCVIQNKKIYYHLTKDFSYYSYEWKLPEFNKKNLKFWLKAFFDCEAWVENIPAKSRLIGLDCCNESSLKEVCLALKRFNIESKIKKKKGRTIWTLQIFGKENLQRFCKEINFLHPKKNRKLKEAIASYVNYNWKISNTKEGLFSFVREKGKICKSRKNQIRFFSIKLRNLEKLKKALNKYQIDSKMFGPWVSGQGSKYYCLIIYNHGGMLNNGKEDWSAFRTK